MNQPNSAAPASILFFSRELFFAPAVKTAAMAAGCQFHLVGRLDADLPPSVTDSVRACVVDLTPLSCDQVVQAGETLRRRFPGARLIAFGPHVQTEHMAAATSAGFDPVIAKGQVATLLPRLLQQPD